MREMCGPELLRLTRWVQRIGKQKQSLHKPRIFRCEHAPLTAAVRVAAETDRSAGDVLQSDYRGSQTFAIRSGLRWMRRSESLGLPERKVATKHIISRVLKRLRNRD